MEELTRPNCALCGVVVPRDLKRFHLLWHDSQSGRSTPLFDRSQPDPEITRLLQVVAALRAAPPVTARVEFVKDLRARLVAGKLTRGGRRLPVAASHCENE